ncbi:MAG: DUF302 domain-containing protein [Candidatus Delongbacteria bacterium]|jgi:uncharacterized protein (DUF302 family)|nr:DUF302 domain-containing protein [Candidatus Delongbacteria bacterium]
MNNSNYGYNNIKDGTFIEALENVKAELQKEGFGILSEIDVKATLKKKLDVDFNNYVILGACNPPNAYKALQSEIEVGLMLPCNVIVYQKSGENIVSVILPTVAMSVIDNEPLKEIASNIESKLKRAIDSI